MRARLAVAVVVALAGSIGVTAAAQVTGQASAEPKGLGFFYADCGFTHRAPDDAIVFPGQPGRSHLHDFFGNKSTDAHSTPESLRAGTTTCHRPTDRSAYWVPTLYQNEARVPVKVLRGSANYSAGYRDFASIQPFPEGLEMIAGDSAATERQTGRNIDWTCTTPQQTLEEGRSPDNSPRAQELRAAIADANRSVAARRAEVARLRKAVRRNRRAVRRQRRAVRRQKLRGHSSRKSRRALVRKRRAFRRSKRTYRRGRQALRAAQLIRDERESALQSYLFGGGTSIPTCKPGSNLELHVKFPDCWDGQNLDSADHKSHMAYSYQAKRGDRMTVCPRSHPVLVPILSFRVIYASRGGPDVRLSPGDVDAGHADFVNAWDQAKLTQLVRDCLNVDKYCGGGSEPAHDQPAQPPTSPTPSPSPSPSPSPEPEPEPEPDPEPEPEPDPDPTRCRCRRCRRPELTLPLA